MIRRLCDIAASVACLVIAAPILSVAAVAVRCLSPGPVLYRQERIGWDGRPFELLKLRTMAYGNTGAQVTRAGDPRVTRVGEVLRRTKIDELPQLWNVLRGDMTLIGPRPEVARFVNQYSDEERQVLRVMPGLASRAQLMYPHEGELLRRAADPEALYVRTLMPRKVAADLAYERERTFWTDLGLAAEIALLVAGRSRRIDRSFEEELRRVP